MCNMGLANITLPIFLVFVIASSAFSDYPPKNPDMISRDQLVSLPYSRLGVASYHMHMHVQSQLSKRTLPLLVGGKGDEGAGLGFLEQPLLAWTTIAVNVGVVGRGNNGNGSLGPKKVLSGLVIMLILLKIFGELGFLPSRKEKRAINSWATMSFHQLSFKKYDDILQCLEGSPEQHPRVVVCGSVDKGNGGAEGVLQEIWSSQDLMSFESKGGGNGTGGDGPKRFSDSCFKLLSMIFTDLLLYLHLQPLYSDYKDGLIEATNCFVKATNYYVETGGGSNSGEEEESGGGSASVGRDEGGGGGDEEGVGGETNGGVGGGRDGGGETGGGRGGGGETGGAVGGRRGGGGGGETSGGVSGWRRGGGSEGGGGDRDGGDLEGRGRGRNYRSPADITELIKISITVATQTSASIISFHFSGQSSVNKVFLSCVVVSNMVGYLCCIASVLLVRRRPPIAEVFEGIGFAAIAIGFLLMTAMFLPNYLWIVGIACVALFLFVVLAFMIRH